MSFSTRKFFEPLPDFAGATWNVTSADAPLAPEPEAPPEPAAPADPAPVEPPKAPEPPPAPATPAAAESAPEAPNAPAPVTPSTEPPPASPVSDQAPTPPPPVKWEDTIKDISITDLLKAKGLDDFAINALDYYTKEGDMSPYLEAKSVDFSKMSDEQIMMYDLQKQHKELTTDELNLLFEDAVLDKYKLDPEVYDVTANTTKAAQLRLKLDAKEKRDKFIESQKAFKAPERSGKSEMDKLNDEHEAWQAEQTKKHNEFVEFVNKDDNSKNLIQNKKVVLGEGDEAFNFEVADPQAIVKSAYTNDFLNSFKDKEGKARLDEWNRVVNYAYNRKAVEKALIDHGKTLGKVEAFKEKTNAIEHESTATGGKENLTPAQALAKQGRVSGGRE